MKNCSWHYGLFSVWKVTGNTIQWNLGKCLVSLKWVQRPLICIQSQPFSYLRPVGYSRWSLRKRNNVLNYKLRVRSTVTFPFRSFWRSYWISEWNTFKNCLSVINQRGTDIVLQPLNPMVAISNKPTAELHKRYSILPNLQKTSGPKWPQRTFRLKIFS